MFDNLKNLASLMSQMKSMRENMERMQAELARKTVTADAGAGAVTVTANGKLEILSIRLDPSMMAALAATASETDRRMVEELIAAAVNAALKRAQELVQQEVGKVTQGLDLPPGLDQMLGQ